MKDINYMSKEDFKKLPHRKWDEKIICDSIIILPADFDWFSWIKYWIKYFLAKILKLEKPEIFEINHMHDSGYRCMDFVAVKGRKPICLLSGCSDVIHIDGIGGYGKDWLEEYGKVPNKILPSGWSIDCLATSGLLRMWPKGEIYCDTALSSFEIYCMKEKSGQEERRIK